MPKCLITLFLAIPLLTASGGVRYSYVLSSQEALDTLRKIDGFETSMRIIHEDKNDTRPFEVSVVSSTRTIAVNLLADGSFRVPVLPEAEREDAHLEHTLEKGALRITCEFSFVLRSSNSDTGSEQNLVEMCSDFHKSLEHLDHFRDELEPVLPFLFDPDLAIVGVSLQRRHPASGRVLLQHTGTTVAEVDLSETGPVEWAFERYHPEEHTIVFRLEDGAQAPALCFMFEAGEKAASNKWAVFLRHSEPNAAPEPPPAAAVQTSADPMGARQESEAPVPGGSR